MLILKKRDFEHKISMSGVIKAIETSLLEYGKKTTFSPLRTHLPIKESNGISLFMPAYIPSMDALGIKIVSVFPDNVLLEKKAVVGEMILLDSKTGEVISIIDGGFLTEVRTGAIGAIGIKYLSNSNAQIMALIGSGGQAEQQIKAALAVRSLTKIKIFDIDPLKSKLLIDKLSKIYKNIIFEISETSDLCIENSDIITTVTTSKNPVFDYKKVSKGTHINGIGSYTKEMNEVPKELLPIYNKIAVDTQASALESGDLSDSINYTEISSIIKDGFKRDQNDLTFFKSTGNAIFDVAVAKYIYSTMLEENN